MTNIQSISHAGASERLASLFGVLAGLGGLLHGIGEVLQGNVSPDAIFIESWKQGPVAEHMGGDPGLTILPNMLATGILAILLSLSLIIWSACFVKRKHGGLILLLLSICLLLLGGGVGPPVLGILAGIGGLQIHASHTWWRRRIPAGFRNFLSRLWPWIFGICAMNGLFLIIGHMILVFLFDVSNASLFLYSFYFAVVSMVACILTGIPYDINRNSEIKKQSFRHSRPPGRIVHPFRRDSQTGNHPDSPGSIENQPFRELK